MKKGNNKKNEQGSKKKGKRYLIVVIGLILVILATALILTKCQNDNVEDEGFAEVELEDQKNVSEEVIMMQEAINEKSEMLEIQFKKEAQLGEGREGIYVGHAKEYSTEDYLSATIYLVESKNMVKNLKTHKLEAKYKLKKIMKPIILPQGKTSYVQSKDLTKKLKPGTYTIIIKYIAINPVMKLNEAGENVIVNYKQKPNALEYATPEITLRVFE